MDTHIEQYLTKQPKAGWILLVSVPDGEAQEMASIMSFLIDCGLSQQKTRAGRVRDWLRELAQLKGYESVQKRASIIE